MNRRTFLRVGGAAAGAAGLPSLAGCTSLFATRSARSPPLADHRPNAVYVPTHSEGMTMKGMADAPDLQLALTYSYPERFWTVTANQVEKTPIGGDDDLHLMTVLWNPDTGVYYPDPGVSLELRQDGEALDAHEVIYPMLSQRMGFHYGANFTVPGDGTYVARITVGRANSRTTGAFRDAFGDSVTRDVQFTYSRQERESLPYETYENAGERGALDPMSMEMVPSPSLPKPADLPGEHLGAASTDDDIVFAVQSLDAPPAGVPDAEEAPGYLAVSARTPYNRMPLPMMGVTATLTRDGETVFDGELVRTLDSDLHYHYGASVAPQAGDELALRVVTPPQVARHEGYETAFLNRSEVSLTL